jgi:hypothetical protein
MKRLRVFALMLLTHAVCMADVVINNPQVDGYGLDLCREWATNCGAPAAHAYCAANGYRAAVAYRTLKDKQRTRVIHGGQVCDAPYCDRISSVTCKEAKVTIVNPQLDGYALDFCREWAANCGLPAANAYCISKGHARALRFESVKSTQKTRIINGGQVCDAAYCTRISQVECESS